MSYILNYTKWNALFEQEATTKTIQADPLGSTGIYLSQNESSTSAKPGVPHILLTDGIKFQIYRNDTGTVSISFFPNTSKATSNGIWKESTASKESQTQRTNLYQPSAGKLDIAKSLNILKEITLTMFKVIDTDLVVKVLNATFILRKRYPNKIDEVGIFGQWSKFISDAKAMDPNELTKLAGGIGNFEQIKLALQKSTI